MQVAGRDKVALALQTVAVFLHAVTGVKTAGETDGTRCPRPAGPVGFIAPKNLQHRGGKAAGGEHLSKREICTQMAICTVSKNLQHPWYLYLHKGSKHKSVDLNHMFVHIPNLF